MDSEIVKKCVTGSGYLMVGAAAYVASLVSQAVLPLGTLAYHW